MKLTKAEALRKITEKYRKSGQEWPATSKMIAAWAIRSGMWEPPKRSIVNQCARELAHAMREEYFVDPQGRRVRKKHAVREEREMPDGTYEQQLLWFDIDEATPRQAKGAFSLRRRQVVGECHQLKTDVDSYNDNNVQGAMIEMLWDLTDDMLELEQPTEYVAA